MMYMTASPGSTSVWDGGIYRRMPAFYVQIGVLGRENALERIGHLLKSGIVWRVDHGLSRSVDITTLGQPAQGRG